MSFSIQFSWATGLVPTSGIRQGREDTLFISTGRGTSSVTQTNDNPLPEVYRRNSSSSLRSFIA